MSGASRNSRLAWLAVLLASIALAFAARFLQDDAFISFRYAEHLASGHGLVFNVGERVEGYTNFLWTILMAIPARMGWPVVPFAQLLGLACFVGTLVVTRRFARAVTGRDGDALLVVILLASNYSFLCYATGGLETQMQTLFVSIVAWLGLEASPAYRMKQALILSLATALAILTRLDSLILMLPIWLFVLFRVRRAGRETRRTAFRWLAAAILPGCVIVAVWTAWKVGYYGALFPNTALVKGPDSRAFGLGFRYIYQFVRSYWMAPVLLLTLVHLGTRIKSSAHRTLLAVLALWSAYMVAVGGDFMEFRMLVPILPLLFIVIVASMPSDRRVRLALAAAVVLGSVSHMRSFSGAGGIEPIRNLEVHVSADGDDWPGIGRTLGRFFRDSDPPVVLATTAVGAIPYYSKLTTVDMLGLTDPWVAVHGIWVGARPGHRRVASVDYLLRKGCHLVLGHPHVVSDAASPCDGSSTGGPAWFSLRDASMATIPPDARIVLVPLDGGRVLRALYLTRHPRIDAAIERHEIGTCPLRF